MKTIKTFLATVLVLALSESGLAQITANRAGKLDRSFAGQGYVDLSVPDRSFVSIENQAKTPDGKIVTLSTTSRDGTFKASLHRVLSTGELDQSFGQNGIAVIDAVADSRNAPALAIQPDGKVLVAGYKGFVSAEGWIVDSYVVRLNSNGTLDTSFGENGLVVRDLSLPGELSHDRFEAVIVKPNAKILLIGLSDRFASAGRTRTYLTLTQLNSDGPLDTAFGQSGISLVEVGSGESDRLMSGLVRAKQLRSGKVAVLTHQRVFESAASQNFQYFSTALRYEENGQLDQGFGEKGRRSYSTGQFSWPSGGLDEDASGSLFFITNGSHLRKLKPNGEPDSDFGLAGVVWLDWSPADMAITSEGRIVAAGYGYLPGNFNTIYSLVRRYHADGSSDIKFGRLGSAYLTIGTSYNASQKLFIDNDGTLLIIGHYSPTISGMAGFAARVFGSHKP